MTTNPIVEKAGPRTTYESFAWKWMRYSAILLILLVWGHVILQDVVVGAYEIDLNYVARRWANLGWRIYDFLLLTLAFSHGVNGLRQVTLDFIHGEKNQRMVNVVLIIFWLALTLMGGVAIIGGVR
jgi:succinate dehydrogenase / fumarate reductase, membrane anchor subunit